MKDRHTNTRSKTERRDRRLSTADREKKTEIKTFDWTVRQSRKTIDCSKGKEDRLKLSIAHLDKAGKLSTARRGMKLD